MQVGRKTPNQTLVVTRITIEHITPLQLHHCMQLEHMLLTTFTYTYKRPVVHEYKTLHAYAWSEEVQNDHVP